MDVRRITKRGNKAKDGKSKRKALEAFKARQVSGMNLSDRVWNYTNMFKDNIEAVLYAGLREGMSATENNIAYRTSDYLRIQNFDFVVGIEVKLSNNHTLKNPQGGSPIPLHDICDELKGKYPKDFKFAGWHPFCRCHAETILKTREEMNEDMKRILDGKEPSGDSVNTVRDVPEAFKGWVERNGERIAGAKNPPYFIRDNAKKYIQGIEFTKSAKEQIREVSTKRGADTAIKLGRNSNKDGYQMYLNAETTQLTPEQIDNIEDIAKDMGVTAKPMTFNEADNGRSNVLYRFASPTSQNCQSCVVVHEARLRGLPITAKEYTASDVQLKIGNNGGTPWLYPKSGDSPTVKPFTGKNEEQTFMLIDARTKSPGRYHIGINITPEDGHIVVAERMKDGRIVFLLLPADLPFVDPSLGGVVFVPGL